MKTPWILSLLIVFSSALLLPARTFTDKRGRHIDADILQVDGQRVELNVPAHSKAFWVPFSELSDADVRYILQWKKEQEESKKPQDKPAEPLFRGVASPLKVEKMAFDKTLWSMRVDDFARQYASNGFVYMSSLKESLRAKGKGFSLLDTEVGEVVVRSKDQKIALVTISLYNRGDDGSLSEDKFDTLFNKVKQAISKQLGNEGEESRERRTVRMTSHEWQWENTDFYLEKSASQRGKTPEFLRLRLRPSGAEEGSMAKRRSLSENVVKESNGDVFIPNVPMIDQGQKGYCAVASAARIFCYYGLDMDQHELAQIAGTGAQTGTSIGEMMGALRKLTGHLHSRVVTFYEYPKGAANPDGVELNSLREYHRDVKKYNRLAKRHDKKILDPAPKNPFNFPSQCDPEVLVEMMTSKSTFKRYISKIQEYINKGIPLAWSLQLGIIPEPDIPQASGGHMRLIIGYNEKTKEIIYTDSWGRGHGKKRMDMGKAFTITTSLSALPPTR